MPTPQIQTTARTSATHLLSKVPEVTVYFWVIKVLCTTVGETFADYLNFTLGLGLSNTTYVMGAGLVAALLLQFRARRYSPGIYWLAVVLISVVGTLITDTLTDAMGVPLPASTVAFAVLLGVVFTAWYAVEKTLSIHSIRTPRRETFYWLAILVTFALGTAAGDLVAEQYAVGYGPSILLFGAAIAVVAIGYQAGRINAVLAFWIAYVLTRPLGASIGDYLSQARADGGLGLGATVTSVLFLAAISGLVVFLTVTRRDAEPADLEAAEA